jgi:hypothetical protein
MTISAGTRSGSTDCHQSPMQIRFYRLDYSRQDFNSVTGEAGGRAN